MVHLRDFQERFGDRVQVLFVYIRGGGHKPPVELEQLVGQSTGLDNTANFERLARAGMKYYELLFPCLLDDRRDTVATQYQAFPKRMLLIDRSGRVALDSGRRPEDPFPWRRVQDWIEQSIPPLPPHKATGTVSEN